MKPVYTQYLSMKPWTVPCSLAVGSSTKPSENRKRRQHPRRKECHPTGEHHYSHYNEHQASKRSQQSTPATEPAYSLPKVFNKQGSSEKRKSQPQRIRRQIQHARLSIGMRGAERQYGPEYGAYTGCPADGKRGANSPGCKIRNLVFSRAPTSVYAYIFGLKISERSFILGRPI